MIYAEGKTEAAIAVLRKAADQEDATSKHVVMPARILPARELLATVLEQESRHSEALTAFETVLQNEPRRLRAAKGAVRCAEQVGDESKQVLYLALVEELTQ